MPDRQREWTTRALAPILALALAGVLAVAPPAPLAAQEAPAPEAAAEDLKAGVEASFRVLRLSEGLLLEPRSPESGVGAIEIGDGILAVDGEPVSVPELRGRLGADADLVLRLYDLGSDTARGLFAEAPESAGVEAEAAAPAAPEAGPPPPPRRPRRPAPPRAPKVRSDAQVVVGNSLTVERDETARDVVVFGGSLVVEGEVVGDAVAIGGSVRIEGEVSGDVSSVGGSVHLGPESEVSGDVVSVGGRVDKQPGARVHGEIVQVPFGPGFSFDWGAPGRGYHGPWFEWFDFSPWNWGLNLVWEIVCIVIVALLVSLVVLLGRGAVERIDRKVKNEPWKSGLVGLVTQILSVPLLIVVCVVLAISIIGIPLLLLVPFAVLAAVIVAFVGYTAVLYRLGRWTEERFGWELPNPYVAALLGLGLVEVWAFLGELLDFGGGPIRFFAVMFTIFGCLLAYLVWTVGLGGAILTRFGTAEGWDGGSRGALPPPPPVPPVGREPGFEAPPAPDPVPPIDEPAPDRSWDEQPIAPEDERQ